jgi:hypothetical protein
VLSCSVELYNLLKSAGFLSAYNNCPVRIKTRISLSMATNSTVSFAPGPSNSTDSNGYNWIAILGLVVAAISFLFSTATFWVTSNRRKVENEMALTRFYVEYGAAAMTRCGDFKHECEAMDDNVIPLPSPQFKQIGSEFERKDYLVYRSRGEGARLDPTWKARVAEISLEKQKLSNFWMAAVAYYKQGQLTSTFFDYNKQVWLQRAQNYLELVEPLSIANFYRNKFYEKSGSYSARQNRPSQFKFIEEMLSKLKGDDKYDGVDDYKKFVGVEDDHLTPKEVYSPRTAYAIAIAQDSHIQVPLDTLTRLIGLETT